MECVVFRYATLGQCIRHMLIEICPGDGTRGGQVVSVTVVIDLLFVKDLAENLEVERHSVVDVAHWPGLKGILVSRAFVVVIGTHAFFLVDFADSTQSFCSSDYGDCLDRDLVAEAGTFAVDNTWDVYVCANAMLFASVDDSGIGTHGLSERCQSKPSSRACDPPLIDHTVTIGGNCDVAAF